MVIIGLMFAFFPSRTTAQDGNATVADQLYVQLNQELIDKGAKPLGRDPMLDAVAEVIADELSTTGSYQSVPPAVAASLGYPAWPDNNRRVITTPFNFIGVQTPSEVASFLSGGIAATLNNSPFREMGIATSSRVAGIGGTEQAVYVIVLGARPNVIPVVINDGSSQVFSRNVVLYLHNEFMLAYRTDDETIQRVQTVRIANSEAELANAEPLAWDTNNDAVPWQLSDGYGEKSVWAEFEDAKGATARYQATVNYPDPESMPTATPDMAALPVNLIMTYGSDTLTLQIESERPTVRLQDVYFTWLDDLRLYQLENADDLFGVNLATFPSNACIQIRVRGQTSTAEVPSCEVIYLEANEFTTLDMVFWNPEFGEFKVYDGDTELGVCDAQQPRCEITYQ
jgi:hypothetical protein